MWATIWSTAIASAGSRVAPRSGLRDVPDALEAVTAAVAGLLVLLPGVHGLALVRPLVAAVGACDHAPVALALVAGGGGQRRPVLGAGAVALALAGACRVVVEGVERHSLGVDERAILGHSRRCGRAERHQGERQRRQRRRQKGSNRGRGRVA